MESYREHLDRRVERRRAEIRASEAKIGCYVPTEEEFWEELKYFREP